MPLFPGLPLSHQLTAVEIDIASESFLRSTVQSQQHFSNLLLSSFPGLLSSSKLLERLKITGQGHADCKPWITCFEGLHWPRLKTLELSYVVISRDELESLIPNHRQSLRELKLIIVHLVNGSNKVADWDTMSNELGALLTLNVVNLANLTEDRHDSGVPDWLEDEHHEGLAQNLMGQHPYTVFLEEVNWDIVAVARRT